MAHVVAFPSAIVKDAPVISRQLLADLHWLGRHRPDAYTVMAALIRDVTQEARQEAMYPHQPVQA